MDLGNWKTQLRKGFMELCILNYLKVCDFYGYDLVQVLKKVEGMAMREGTIYPIMARLQEDGLVTNYMRDSQSGPPRKYFRLTRQGGIALEEMNRHWHSMESAMQSAIEFKEGRAS